MKSIKNIDIDTIKDISEIEGGVCAPKGFLAAATYCGIRKNKNKKDLALIYSEVPCNAAALYTSNKVKAAPLHVTMEHLRDGKAQAIIVNSGNANACASEGYENAVRMATAASKALGIDCKDVIVASTGVIGVPLDIGAIEAGVPTLAEKLSCDGGSDVAEAIMTTDTYKKEYAVAFELGGKTVRIGGASKGSGMIHPNMATTLNFITSDVDVDGELLEKAWRYCVNRSFNRISIDGDTSTNDMACILTNGLAGNPRICEGSKEYEIFVAALLKVCVHLAKELARDGEGASRLLSCTVKNAADEEKAEIMAKAVIASSLTKAAMWGGDANWGRVLCAMGYSGAEFNYEKTDIWFRSKAGEILVCQNGQGLEFDEALAGEILSADEIEILADLKEGEAEATAWGCDLTCEYVKINGSYRT
ncbi:MAG: bifunctional glutamate N-acetyltransferase/amino-acid acetyltransferase ArgJ [Anaerovoracaceae bacterium]|jgi:glutamate N-acetyltransferase/amino-acid N-acetyltransferase